MSRNTAVCPSRKLRILCFHGYLQNAKEFAGKMGSLRKALKSRAELIFVQAPHHVDAQQSISDPAVADARAWWSWEDPDVAGRPSLASSYTGVEGSLQAAAEAMAEHEPVDGFLGGPLDATYACVYLALAASSTLQAQAGAFLPKDPRYAQMMTTNLVRTPTLFIYGEKDQLVPPQRTEELIATFDPDSVHRFVHSGGHMVPTCTGEFKKCMHDFLDKHAMSQS